MNVKLLESIKSKLEKANIFPEEDEIIAYGNEVISDIDYLTNVDTSLDLCTNAIIEGVLSKYLPDRLPLYLQQIKVIRLNAYNDESPDNYVYRGIKDKLRLLPIPKVNDVELQNKVDKEVKPDIFNLTNVDTTLEICMHHQKWQGKNRPYFADACK